jgi:hypothetical protein
MYSKKETKMIDFNEESLISLQEAAKILPRRRAGRPVHVSCVYRWTQIGVKGIVLESVQVGGSRCTSRAALNRFFERLTEIANGNRPLISSPPLLSADRKKAIAQARKKLVAAGV